MRLKLLFTFMVLMFLQNFGFGQCTSFPSGATSVGTYSFCIDNSNTITTANVSSQKYVIVNVIKGFNYTFSVGNISGNGTNENLTIFNASDTSISLTNNYNDKGVSLSWTATFSGQIYVLFTRGNDCSSTDGTSGAMTITLNSIGNTQDDQSLAGIDKWRGHIYNWTGTAPPGGASPSSPSATNPFSSAQYAGYYDVGTETINEGFGGDAACFKVFSNGTQRASIYTQQYAVRYRMNTTKSGCYLVNITGDDGVRLYLNNSLILDKWVEQSSTTYNNVLVTLDGNDDFIFDYYENAGQNVVAFSMVPFNTSNTITPATSSVCSGTAVTLDGSSYLVNGATNPYLTFKWESSPNNMDPWTNTGVTTEDYSPAPTVTTYYRRVVTGSIANSGCSVTSTSVVINVPTVISTTPNTKTYTGVTNTTTVSAVASAGATIEWYDAPSGGNLLGSNTTYAPTGINAGTYTVYAQAKNTTLSCVSASRTAVTLTIAPAVLSVTPKAVSTSYTGGALNNTTYSTTTGNYTITGFVNSQTIASAGIGFTGSMSFNSSTSTIVKNAGTYTQAVGTLAMSSTNNNYTMTFSNAVPNNYIITPKVLTITGVATADKVYDGTTAASVTGGILIGVVSPDVVTFTQSGTFATKNAGTGVAITSTSTIGGADAGNYTLTQPVLTARNITAKALTITGATTADKVYDGTTVASVTGGTLIGIVSPDVVTLTQSGTFATKNAGTGIAITSTSTIGGADAGNYTLTQPALTARNITAKALTVAGAATADKVYDGTTVASVTGGTLIGIVSPDAVTLTQSGTFATKNAGTGIAITSTSTIGGADAGNYTLTQPALTARNITAKALTVTGATTADKVYDGTTVASVTGGTLIGIVLSDAVTLTQSGTFATKNAGTGIAITSTSSIGGADAGNYTLIQPALTARDITAKVLTVTGATVTTKTYDGTTVAVISGASLSGVLPADTANVTLGNATTGTFNNANAGTGKAVTTAPMTISGTASGNYSLTQPALTGTITAATLTITANNRNKCFGTALILGTTDFTTSALQNGETITSVTLISTGGYDASLTQGAGLYAGNIIPSNPTGIGFSASNYAITTINGDLKINGLPNNVTDGFAATTICTGGSPQLTYDADDSTFTLPYSIIYKNNASLAQYTIAIPSASPFSFTPGDNPTANTGYTLVSISNGTCTNSTVASFGDSGANLIVRPMATASISGTTSVCIGDTRPNIVFTNPNTVAITVTYTINNGANQTINIAASSTSSVAIASTATSGSFVYDLVSAVYQNTPGCSNTITGSATVTVRPDSGNISLNGVSYASNSITTYCASNTAVFSISSVSGASSYSWTVPAGWTILSGQGTTSITASTGSNAQSGTVFVLANNLFCPSYLGVTLSTIPPVAPSVSVTSLTCAVPKGTIKVNTPAPASGIVYTLTGTSPATVPVTNTSGVFSNLAAGDYVVTYQQGSGCVSVSTGTITIQPLVTKTWNGAWSPAGSPSLNDHVIFDADYNQLLSVNSCSCTVNSGVNVIIPSGKVLTVVNDLQVDGTLTFKNGASLIQKNENPNPNTLKIIYERTATGIKDFDYVYWSSPVAGQTLGVLSPSSDKYWSWLGDYWTPGSKTESMIAGKGYIARVPRYVTSQTVNFKGTPNNGDVIIAVQGDNKSNLIGNPYPSAIDAEQFMLDNQSVIPAGGMLAFWTHTTKRTLNGSGTQYEYESEDYSFFNITGGTGTSIGSGSGGSAPDGTIAAGQSFMVGSITDLNNVFKFTNSMRLEEDNKNSHFFKQANVKKTAKIEKNRVWLNLSNDGGAFKQLLVGYITGATNDADKLFDGITRNSNAFVDFYSINNSMNYTIQGRGLPFNEEDEVPLGYQTAIAGAFQIAIDKTDGFLANQTVYLEDKTANVIHDLTKGPYSFATAKGEFKDRFVLRYTNTSKLGTGDFDAKGKGVVVSVKNSQIKINSFEKAISSVKVYDLKGSLLYEKDKADRNEFVINHLNSSNQFMIVMVQLEDGKWVSEEIIFHE